MVSAGFNKFGAPVGFGQPTVNKPQPISNPLHYDPVDDNPMQPQYRTPLQQAILPQANPSTMKRAEPGGIVGPPAHLPSIPFGVTTQQLVNGQHPVVTANFATDPNSWIRQTLQAEGSTDDPNYWIQKNQQWHDPAYLQQRIKQAGTPEFPGGIPQGGQAGGLNIPMALMMGLMPNSTPNWQNSLAAIRQQQQAAASNPLTAALMSQ